MKKPASLPSAPAADPVALDSWFEMCRPFLVLIARQRVRCQSDAEDVVQESLVRYWRWGRRHATDPKAYLVRCVHRAASDFLQAQNHRTRRAQGSALEAAEPMFECVLELQERRVVLEEALSRLSEEQRTVLIMHIWGEMTFAQVGEALEISPNTAASRYRYALEGLRGLLGPGGS
jgi:RNA polymerase sigma-70 factor (ECF subfamily)